MEHKEQLVKQKSIEEESWGGTGLGRGSQEGHWAGLWGGWKFEEQGDFEGARKRSEWMDSNMQVCSTHPARSRGRAPSPLANTADLRIYDDNLTAAD